MEVGEGVDLAPGHLWTAVSACSNKEDDMQRQPRRKISVYCQLMTERKRILILFQNKSLNS